MSSLPSASLPEEKRAELLARIADGHDVETACAALGISEDQIVAAGDELKAEISGAFKTGTARLRSRLLETALDKQDVSALARLLDKREAIEKAQVAEDADEMSNFETCRRILFMLAQSMADDAEKEKWMALVLRARCEHCGQFPYVPKPPSTIPIIPFRRSPP